MSNLNVNPQDGRILQATETPTANMGSRVARAYETTKMSPGTMGNAQGELDAANARAKAAQQITSVVQDASTRLTNLQLAEEETRKHLLQQDWHVKDQEARTYAKQQAVEQGLDTDQQHQLYKDERAKRTGELRSKYEFVTRIGNDIDQRIDLWTANADADYMDKVIVPARVDNVKAGQVQLLQNLNEAFSSAAAGDKTGANIGQLLTATRDSVLNITSSPQFVAVWGEAAAQKIAHEYIRNMQIDAIAQLTNTDPKLAMDMLRDNSPDSDKFTAVDPSIRRQMLFQATKEFSAREKERKEGLKLEQDKREAEISFGIVTGQIRGNDGIKLLVNEWNAGKIDQSHFERGITKIQIERDRQERRAEAARERAAREQEKYRARLQPAYDAIETGIPLDPKNPTHVKANEAYVSELLKKGNGKDQAAVLLDAARTTGIPSRALTSTINARINSKDPKEAVIGVQLLAKVAETVPGVIHSIQPETVSIANQVSLGVPVEQAKTYVERARTLTKEQKDEYEKVARKEYTKLESDIKKSFGVKALTPEAYGHAKGLFNSQLILAGGNVEAAREATANEMRKSYGVSYLTGSPVLMKDAPEGVNGKTDWMIKQFESDLKPLNLKPDQVRLVANKNNSYDLYLVENGVIKTPLTNESGKRLTWEPDMESVVKAEQEAAKTKAQKVRDSYLDTPPSIIQPVDKSVMLPKGKQATLPTNKEELPFGKFQGKQ